MLSELKLLLQDIDQLTVPGVASFEQVVDFNEDEALRCREQIFCDSRLFNGSPEGPFSLLKLWTRSQQAGRLYGVVHDGDWFHVGTPAALAEAERVLG